jgi:kynurenine 3-monooxygenase
MVTFHHDIPYRVAYERGKVQAGILEQLTRNAGALADISVAAMDALVLQQLEPLAAASVSAG